MFKHLRFRQCLFLNVFEPPYLISQTFNFTTLRPYLHPYVNKELLQWYSCFVQSTGHVNVQTNQINQLRQFIMRNDSFPTAFSLFLQGLSDLTSRGAAIYHIWQPYQLLHLKYPNIQLFVSVLVKRFQNLRIRIRNG